MRAIAILLFLAGTVCGQYRFPPVYDDYVSGSNKAAKAGKPLVTFVGCQPFEVQGVVVCMTLYLPEYPAQCVVISKDGYWKATLTGASCEAVCKEVDRLTVAPFRYIAAPLGSANC